MRIVEVARTWINTPYADHQSVKGVYCDCIGFILGVAEEMGLKIDHSNYPLTPTGDDLVKEIDRYLIRVDREYPCHGDILCFKTSIRGIPTHVGIASDVGLIHADSRAGKIVETSLGYWEKLIVGYWILGENSNIDIT